MDKKFTHDELQHDLAEYLRGKNDVMAWENMQIGPSGSPRPDVYAIGKTFTRFCPVTYEIKVSVSDFRSDITSGKWQSYLKFSGAVIFATPAGMISKADLPVGCGLIQRSESGWRIAKAPTMQRVENLDRDHWLKLLMGGIEREAERKRFEFRSRGSDWIVKERLNKKYGADVGELVAKALHSKAMVEHELQKLEKQRDEIKQQTQWELKMALDDVKRSHGTFHKGYEELIGSLGLSPDANQYDCMRAMKEIARRLEADGEINKLRNLFKDAKVIFDKALTPIALNVEG